MSRAAGECKTDNDLVLVETDVVVLNWFSVFGGCEPWGSK